ncbi:MAG: hypothetical protein NTY95_15860 [Bacteroidia bacterium]|nr:hypothetical protein [Bacteroidia bacterium]
MKKIAFLFSVFLFTQAVLAQKVNNFAPDFSSPPVIPGMTLVWNDEFNIDGKPDPASIQIRGFRQWQFGRFEIRPRIDIMEFYRIKDVPIILANFAWGTEKEY